jgi:hypothetical protein
MVSRAGLNTCESSDHPALVHKPELSASSRSRHRLRYAGPYEYIIIIIIIIITCVKLFEFKTRMS